MPAIAKGDLILVTGVSGYIAAHTAEKLLDEGYPVRGTVRSKEKGEFMANVLKGKKAKFDYVIVKDIGEDDAFDEAVKGVDGIAHMASPFHFNADEPEELIRPAVNGTVGILKSAKKNNPKVKRVVITSSVAAIMDSTAKPPVTFTEADWNPVSIKECEEKGRDAAPGDKYRASKTLAEKAFWKYIEDEKPSFDGATINPPLVLGPIIHPCDSPDSLNTSVAAFYGWLAGKKTAEDLPGGGGNYIDVRDVAKAHVRALEVEEASGQRFICGNGPFSANDYCVVLNKDFPDQPNVPKGDPNAREKINSGSPTFDGAKSTKVLGVHYTPIETTIKDMAINLKEKFNV